ncbi:hypothetical protein GOBAR_DD11878 [Gossypium barbadense]|nr:hypothetical protein GOBAR_DD11878 [Gossypium barbadense]
MQGNSFKGPLQLPKHVNVNMFQVDMSGNKMQGQIPMNIGSMFPHLQILNLSRNVFEDLGQNNLTRKIPYWIANLSALRILVLRGNHFEGEIPSQICQLNLLSIVDLSQNKLSGHIPSCLSTLTLMPTDKSFRTASTPYLIDASQDLSLYFQVQVIDIPVAMWRNKYCLRQRKDSTHIQATFLSMSGIDVSCNMLTGPIPPELGNLSELHSLNLSHNSLIGFKPSLFSKLEQIESLDLSRNKLSGIIPIQLMELNSLAVFNVSYDDRGGAICAERVSCGGYWQMLLWLNLQRLTKAATWEILFFVDLQSMKVAVELVCPTTPNASSSEEESGFMDKHAFLVSFLASYLIVLTTIGVVLYINPYWQRRWFYFIEQCINTCHNFIVDNVSEEARSPMPSWFPFVSHCLISDLF